MISLIRNDPVLLLLILPTVLIALTFHEIAHGYVAYKCGDQTAKMMGRLSFNPMKHLDLFGTLMMFFVGFGWAKPVPINTRNFRKPKRDIALVSAAGPVANLILALFGTVLYFASVAVFLKTAGSDISLGELKALDITLVFYNQIEMFSFLDNIQQIILQFLALFALLNAGLAIFNLLPIPPLDGSKLLASALPRMLAARYLQFEYYTRFLLLGLLFMSYILPGVGNIIWVPIEFFRTHILSFYQWLVLLVF